MSCHPESEVLLQAEVRHHHGPARRDDLVALGICVICLSAPAAHVDHCHETGRVRGVLCFNCNSAIGKLGDDPDTLRRATAYLEGNAWKPTLVAPGVYRLPS
ncbi:endonuclease VII domain-containing protein [Streptomyces niveus]|uniref:endonuclease VII domain-containing protein n=1 Tax=Streptomyces niveus TaxID=193462 RepID=UPI003001EBDF